MQPVLDCLVVDFQISTVVEVSSSVAWQIIMWMNVGEIGTEAKKTWEWSRNKFRSLVINRDINKEVNAQCVIYVLQEY